ncbi:MAG: gliding motility-associated C-terminal domain-containing protein [Bacteroidetes bacterium]|nr:gliding motility-associated C-terminal domain-containing protein [Bacteroidota bacterium]
MFRRKLEHADVPAPEGVWEAVSGQIATQAVAGSAGTALTGLIMKGAAALLIAGASYLAYRAYMPQPPQKEKAPQTSEETQNQSSAKAEQVRTQLSEQPASINDITPGSRTQPLVRSENASVNEAGIPATQSTTPQETLFALPEAPKQDGNTGNNQDNPCLHAPIPRLNYTEIAPSVLQLHCTEQTAAKYEAVWYLNGREIGRGNDLNYTVINQRSVKINLKYQGTKLCNTETGDVEITLQGCDLENNLLIPNVFTPNADGINDPYRVLICGAEAFQLSIYDRAGRRFFSTSDPESGWDGRINGSPAPEGMYIAKLRYRFYGHSEQEKTVMLWLKGASNQ